MIKWILKEKFGNNLKLFIGISCLTDRKTKGVVMDRCFSGKRSFNEGDVAPMYMGTVEFVISNEILGEIRK